MFHSLISAHADLEQSYSFHVGEPAVGDRECQVAVTVIDSTGTERGSLTMFVTADQADAAARAFTEAARRLRAPAAVFTGVPR